MDGDTDIATLAALLADSGRARIVLALGDGRALAASVLADEAGVAPSTASEHLARLVAAGLLSVERHGRHRYYRLAGPEVGELIEALARFAPAAPVRSLRQGTRAQAVRSGRTCYDHLAGRLGTALMRALLADGTLAGGDGTSQPGVDRLSAPGQSVHYRVTEQGAARLRVFGIDVDALGRARCFATASTGPSSATTSPAGSAPRSPSGCSNSTGSGAAHTAAQSRSLRPVPLDCTPPSAS